MEARTQIAAVGPVRFAIDTTVCDIKDCPIDKTFPQTDRNLLKLQRMIHVRFDLSAIGLKLSPPK